MSFTIPNIPYADPNVERPRINSSPSVDGLARIIDLERSIATEGRVIWGFTRLPDGATPEPTQPFVLEEGKSDWLPFFSFITRVPLLGAGPYFPTTGGGDIGMAVWMLGSAFDVDLRVILRRLSDNASGTFSPIPTIDTNGFLRWEIDDIPDTVAKPGDLIVMTIETQTPSALAPVEIYAMSAYWLDITDIEP